MKEKYPYLISILLIILLFTTITNASLLDYKQRIYEKLEGNPTYQKITDIISNISYYNDYAENILDTNNTNISNNETHKNNESTYYDKLENRTILVKIIGIITQFNEKFAIMLQRLVQNIFSFRKSI